VSNRIPDSDKVLDVDLIDRSKAKAIEDPAEAIDALAAEFRKDHPDEDQAFPEALSQAILAGHLRVYDCEQEDGSHKLGTGLTKAGIQYARLLMRMHKDATRAMAEQMVRALFHGVAPE
jgi:hypothetical protein